MKVTEDGVITTHAEMDRYPRSLTIDKEDNVYILNGKVICLTGGSGIPSSRSIMLPESQPTSRLKYAHCQTVNPLLQGIAVSPMGTSLFATDENAGALYHFHNTVHGFHLGFPYYKNKIENTLTTETNSPHPDPPLTTTPVTPSTSTVTSSNRQTSHWKRNLTLGGLVLAGTTATGLYLTNSIVDTYTNPNAPSRDHWDPAVESWLPGLDAHHYRR